jgi:hypothetical protein
MSGSNDASLQALLLGMRNQQRRPSAQARLAEQMMASLNNPAPIYGAGPAIARVGSGVLAGLMGGMAERSDQEREDRQLQQVQDRQDKRQYLDGQEATQFAQRFRLPGAAPAEPPAEGQHAASQGQPDWRAAALAGFGSNNPAIQRQAQAALSIGQMEDQQAARQEQVRLQREVAMASRAPRAPEPMVVVQTPEGPRYVPQSQAVGREPARVQQPGSGGPFQGSAMDAQALNILLSTSADPTTPTYAAAFNQVFGPRTVTQADGSTVTIQPQAPQGIRAPVVAPPAMLGSEAPQTPPQAAPVTAAPVVSPMPQAGASAAARPPATTPEVTQTPGATVTRVPGTGGTLTEGQSRANMFGLAMNEGHTILQDVRIPNDAAIIAWRNAPESLVNLGLSENDQRYFNALRQFAAGVLRKETGAAFGANELLDVQSRFFPMPGDSLATRQQKARARLQAIEAMRNEMPGAQFRGQLPSRNAGSPELPPGFEVIR